MYDISDLDFSRKTDRVLPSQSLGDNIPPRLVYLSLPFFCTRQTGCGLYMSYSIFFTEITFYPEILLQIK